MKTPPLRCAALCVLLASLDATAAPAERIRESETKQEAIRSDAQRIVEQLDAMLDEYQRNGLGGEDAATVRGVRGSIEHLTAEEMKQVVALLEKARGAGDDGAAKKTVAEAFAAQKAILTQMQRLLDQHRRNQQALELAQTLTQLADRQGTNLQNGITLGQWAGGKKPEQFEAAMQANLEGQKSEQAAIAAELRMAEEKLAAFTKEAPDAETAARFQKALDAMQKVQPGVDTAAEALAQAQLFKAVAQEKVARDELRRIAREVAPRQDKATALRNAERDLEKLVEEQREIVADVRKQTAPSELPALEAPQADVALRSDVLAQDLQKNAAAAAQAVNAAQQKMQDARAGMAEQNANTALKGAQDALTQLEAALAQVAQQAAQAEALAGRTGDPMKDLQALQQQTQQLAQQQAAAARNPDKSQQPALAQHAAELAQRAEQMAPQAAPAMQQAAANAQQAAQQGQQPAQATAAQQAAAQNLQQAAQQLAQQAAAMQQEPAPMNADAMQAAQDQLAEAAQQLAQAQQNLEAAQAAQAAQQQAQQAGQPNAASASAQQAANAMQQASAQAAQAANEAGAAAKGAASNPSAQSAAQQAAQAAAEAASQSAGNQPSAAQASAGQAQAALAQAQAVLAQAQVGVTPSQQGMPGPSQQSGPPGSKPGNQPGTPGGTTAAQKYTPGAPESVQTASRAERLKKANFTGLPPRERAAIEQSQGEKYPEEYGPQVEQYLLNLARESAGR